MTGPHTGDLQRRAERLEDLLVDIATLADRAAALGTTEYSDDDQPELRIRLRHLEARLAVIGFAAAPEERRRSDATTRAPRGLKGWSEANFDALNCVPPSDADERYGALLDEIEETHPALRAQILELDAIVGERLSQHIDHATSVAWRLLGGEKP